jgi:PTH1 family peptidyl-tRNA hydrolase
VFAIVGLGNPGSEYEGTRHNVGFSVVDAIAHKEEIDFRNGYGNYVEGSKRIQDVDLLLVKPMTFMNNSGETVRDIALRYELELRNILVIVDDFQIPFGTLRLRRAGSDGGHNGLYSIIYRLQSHQFPRLRCGIGTTSMPEKSEMSDFVLSKFERNERTVLIEMIEQARDAALAAATQGIDTAIEWCNRKRI